MTIDNLKQLKQLIKICQDTGVHSIEVDGIKMAISPKATKRSKTVTSPSFDIPEASIKVPAYNGPLADPKESDVDADSLTEEQLLMWSAGGHSEIVGEQQ